MKFLKKGILTSFQDLGRAGYQSYGVNLGGAMDIESLKILNILLENNLNEAALEIHFPAPIIVFEEKCVFAITGGNFDAHLNTKSVVLNKLVFAKAGDFLKFNTKINGERAYFGVYGGFNLIEWLNSKSTNLQLNFPVLPESFSVNYKELPNYLNTKLGFSRRNFFERNFNDNIPSLRFVSTYEFESLTIKSKYEFEKKSYKISTESNRMAYKLESETLKLENKVEKISSAVTRGNVQLLPNGQLLILMADAQTTGGYPNIGFIIEQDLDLLAQKMLNSEFKIKIISLEAAIVLKIESLKKIEKLKRTLELLRHDK
jgi:antagonist of KipI